MSPWRLLFVGSGLRHVDSYTPREEVTLTFVPELWLKHRFLAVHPLVRFPVVIPALPQTLGEDDDDRVLLLVRSP